MIRAIASFGYVGYLRPAPGTWGSLAALPIAWAIHVLGGPLALLVAIGLATGIGLWVTALILPDSDDGDPSWIVIDEVAGQWLALLPVSFGASHAGADMLALWPGWVVAFLVFRLFDIWKPGPIGWVDRRGGAAGVMLDDLMAGACGAVAVGLGAWLSHGVIGL